MHINLNRGFTLIEVMIVVVIIAILSAVAIPSYRNHVCKVERNQAKADLMGLAQAMERYYTVNNFTYVGATSAIFSTQSPIDGTARFNLSIDGTPTNSYFKVQAARVTGGSCGDGPFTLDSAGVKSANWSD